jgi:multidrug efflux system outer membrane protein
MTSRYGANRSDKATRAQLGAVGLVLLTGMAGCSSAYSPMVSPGQADLPLNWSVAPPVSEPGATRSAAELARWWSAFGDPLLSQLVDAALLANTSVLSAQATWRQARASRDVAASALWPFVAVSASAGRARTGGVPARDAFAAGMDASWELDVFDLHRHAVDAADATVLPSAATLGDVQASIAAEVALHYITLRDAQARLAIAARNLGVQQETWQLARWRLQAGLVTALDTEQARAAAEQTAALLPPLQTSVDQAAHALAVLTGHPPASLASTLASPRSVPDVAQAMSWRLPAQTLRQRADVRAAEWQVSAAISRVDQARAARAPSFQLSGSLGVSALTLGALGDGPSVAGSLLAAVSWPLFDGGALRAQQQAQQAALDGAVAAYRATVLLALQEVEDALVGLRDTRLRLGSLNQAADAATQAAQLANQRYSGGLVDFQTVLDTQRTQLTTQDSVASARAALGSGHVLLYKALGGGWQADALTPAP